MHCIYIRRQYKTPGHNRIVATPTCCICYWCDNLYTFLNIFYQSNVGNEYQLYNQINVTGVYVISLSLTRIHKCDRRANFASNVSTILHIIISSYKFIEQNQQTIDFTRNEVVTFTLEQLRPTQVYIIHIFYINPESCRMWAMGHYTMYVYKLPCLTCLSYYNLDTGGIEKPTYW